MGLISWLYEKLGGQAVPVSGEGLAEDIDEYYQAYADVYYRELAFWSTVNTIANAVSKCEFKTYSGGVEKKGAEYYLWNVEPNKNQNSSGFIHKWIAQLYRHNECLIIEQNGQLLVADSFIRTPYALYDDIFTNVTVGDFSFSRSFSQSEVLYWQLSEKDMRKVTAALYQSYSKLLAYSMKAYQKSRGTKGIFNYETLPVAGSEQRKAFDDLLENKFKTFMSTGDAILPLGSGQSYADIGSKTYSSESTRDIRAMVDDISDFTAKAFGVPPALLHGDVQGVNEVTDQLLTFCVDPLCCMLEEEINRKRYGQSEFLKRNYMQIDTKSIKHIDLLSVSTSIDKLISSGAYSINDIRRLCNDEPIDADWANRHMITKNYTVADLMATMEGNDDGTAKKE
ncbi:phage portal protein [Caproiciproducens sp. CPB-2]|uniref:phage portal protein n=1 Tax=Caproiciproducens sp. CPB-2 TaxID=3030017 RepID=UPI0023DCA6CE|nr:phage portal protein [Caproiciproducens sp. CPB-2]MDF1495219.1 phage portal protein [Caproiciproducens sp. CPB-2]